MQFYAPVSVSFCSKYRTGENHSSLEKNIFPQLKLLIFILKEQLSNPVIKCSSVFISVFCPVHGPAALHGQGALTSCPDLPQEMIDRIILGYLFNAKVNFRIT